MYDDQLCLNRGKSSQFEYSNIQPIKLALTHWLDKLNMAPSSVRNAHFCENKVKCHNFCENKVSQLSRKIEWKSKKVTKILTFHSIAYPHPIRVRPRWRTLP